MDRSLKQVKPHRLRQPACGVAGWMKEAGRLVQPLATEHHLPGPMRELRAGTPRNHTAPDIEPTRCRAVPAGRMQWETRSMAGSA